MRSIRIEQHKNQLHIIRENIEIDILGIIS